MKLAKRLKKIFWDVAAKEIDARKHRGFVIARVAEKGGIADVQWLKKNYSLRTIKKEVAKSRNVGPKAKAFWKLI